MVTRAPAAASIPCSRSCKMLASTLSCSACSACRTSSNCPIPSTYSSSFCPSASSASSPSSTASVTLAGRATPEPGRYEELLEDIGAAEVLYENGAAEDAEEKGLFWNNPLMVSLGWSNLRCKGSLSCRSLNKRKSLSQSGCNPHFQPIWNCQQLTSNQIQSKFLFQPSTQFIAVDNYTFSTQIGHQGSKLNTRSLRDLTRST